MTKSSRARVLLLAPVLAAGFLFAGAGPASAAASPNANCVGVAASNGGATNIVAAAQNYYPGYLGLLAKTNCGALGG